MSDALSIHVPESILTIAAAGGRELVRIATDGQITYGEGYTPDVAAQIFWKAIAGCVPDLVGKQAAEIERLRGRLSADGSYAIALHSDGTHTDMNAPFCRECGSNNIEQRNG